MALTTPNYPGAQLSSRPPSNQLTITEVENGFVIKKGQYQQEMKVALSLDDMLEIVKDVFGKHATDDN